MKSRKSKLSEFWHANLKHTAIGITWKLKLPQIPQIDILRRCFFTSCGDLGPPFWRAAIPGYYCYNNPNPNPNTNLTLILTLT